MDRGPFRVRDVADSDFGRRGPESASTSAKSPVSRKPPRPPVKQVQHLDLDGDSTSLLIGSYLSWTIWGKVVGGLTTRELGGLLYASLSVATV
jgi:hypothetical protein